jgi:hypothetical protein
MQEVIGIIAPFETAPATGRRGRGGAASRTSVQSLVQPRCMLAVGLDRDIAPGARHQAARRPGRAI